MKSLGHKKKIRANNLDSFLCNGSLPMKRDTSKWMMVLGRTRWECDPRCVALDPVTHFKTLFSALAGQEGTLVTQGKWVTL